MDAGVEAHTGTIKCNYCEACNPWILCNLLCLWETVVV